MIHMIGQALIGLVIGVIAKLLLPGTDPGGWIVTAIIGLVGGWFGGWIGRALGWYKQGEPADQRTIHSQHAFDQHRAQGSVEAGQCPDGYEHGSGQQEWLACRAG